MHVAVVGSGPAGISAAHALTDRGVKVTLLDVGETLDPERQGLADRLGDLPPESWDRESIRRLSENPTISARSTPKKLLFGSDFIYAFDRPHSPIEAAEQHFAPTFARGGYSSVWGAALLPIEDADMSNWPFRRGELEPYFQKVVAGLPLCGGAGSLDEAFPAYGRLGALRHGHQAGQLLGDLADKADSLRSRQILFGPARLAVHDRPVAGTPGCHPCGLCLSGCPRRAIHGTGYDLDRLIADGRIQYVSDTVVERLEEVGQSVAVTVANRRTQERSVLSFDALFLGAGVLGTTRILLQSKGLFDRNVVLKESPKFLLPLLRLSPADDAFDMRRIALASIFMELKVSGHWVHAQISELNRMMLTALGIDVDASPSWRQPLLSPALRRLMVAWCGLHSDHGADLNLRLVAGSRGAPSVLNINCPDSSRPYVAVRQAARALFRAGLSLRSLFLLPLLRISGPGTGYHCGGTFPMTANPHQLLDADILGRPFGWSRVFAVDASVFPSIPGTTNALNVMANARRIGTLAPLG